MAGQNFLQVITTQKEREDRRKEGNCVCVEREGRKVRAGEREMGSTFNTNLSQLIPSIIHGGFSSGKNLLLVSK